MSTDVSSIGVDCKNVNLPQNITHHYRSFVASLVVQGGSSFTKPCPFWYVSFLGKKTYPLRKEDSNKDKLIFYHYFQLVLKILLCLFIEIRRLVSWQFSTHHGSPTEQVPPNSSGSRNSYCPVHSALFYIEPKIISGKTDRYHKRIDGFTLFPWSLLYLQIIFIYN